MPLATSPIGLHHDDVLAPRTTAPTQGHQTTRQDTRASGIGIRAHHQEKETKSGRGLSPPREGAWIATSNFYRSCGARTDFHIAAHPRIPT